MSYTSMYHQLFLHFTKQNMIYENEMNHHLSLNGSICFPDIFFPPKKKRNGYPAASVVFLGGISWSFVNAWASTGLQNTRRFKETTPKQSEAFFCETKDTNCRVCFGVLGGWICFFAKIDLIGTKTWLDGMMV